MSSTTAAKSASRIQRITEGKCREWAANPTINPLTGKEIEIDGPTYNALKDRCLNKYNIALPEAAVGVFSRGHSPDPNAANATAAASSPAAATASSASVETKNRTAGWKTSVPETERAAIKIVEKIGDQIWHGIKSLVTAQNKDPVNGLKSFNVAKIFKNLPYYRPYIDSINNEEIFDNVNADTGMWRVRGPLIRKAIHQRQAGAYTPQRLVRLVDPNAPKVIVILHKVFTFLRSLMLPYYEMSYPEITDVLNAIRPHLAEAQRKVDNLNIALIMRRASQATQTPGANELATNIAGLMLQRRPGTAAAQAQGGRRKK
jgi:hypothetical protein